jgi:peptidoglycan hydrolase CwlO-like protein
MKINSVIITSLIVLFVYLLVLNLIRYNTIIEGNTVTLDSSDIEHIYTNKQKLQNMATAQSNIEAEIAKIDKEINPIKKSYKKKNKEMTAVTEKAGKEMEKQSNAENA